jgi:hypothetical protein
MNWGWYLFGLMCGVPIGMFTFALLSISKMRGGRDDRP